MNKDKRFIKDKLTAEPLDLPEALSGESIVSLIENEAQTKAKKRNYVPFVLSAAAAVIVIVAGVLSGTGILNKAPDVNVPHETVSPETVHKTQTDYTELSKLLSANIERLAERGTDFDSITAEEGVTGAPAASAPTESENTGYGDHSTLNTRTEGVDEADVMKTDGEYIYALKSDGWASGGSVYFMPYDSGSGIQTFSVFDRELNKIGQLSLRATEKSGDTIRERNYTGFFLYNDYVIFTGSETSYNGKGLVYNEDGEYWDIIDPKNVETKTISLVSIYDISNKAKITPVKDLYFSGSLLSSRITQGKLIAVSSYYPNYSLFNAEDYTTFVPEVGEKGEYVSAESINVLDEEAGNFTTVSLVNLDSEKFEVSSISLLGQAWELYCSGENVYTYGQKSRFYAGLGWANVLSINKINVGGDSPAFVATADIDGVSLNDSFSIDEYGGYLRLAVDDFSDNGISNCCRVLVLDENMKKVGETEGFAEGEYIRSARFMGDTAYVVTFRNTDPLFVIDLTDVTDPVIKGEVSLPGFSAYLHPAGEKYLVGIGFDGTEDGLNGGAKISLFDISDPENPFEADNYTIADAGLDSDYKNFVKKGDSGYIVNFYEHGNYSINTAGALYFTVKDGKINTQMRITAGRSISIIKTIFIENTVYFLTNNANNGYKIMSFDLMSGEKMDMAEIG